MLSKQFLTINAGADVDVSVGKSIPAIEVAQTIIRPVVQVTQRLAQRPHLPTL